MAKRTGSRHVLVVLTLCVLWYIVSSTNNVIGKVLLNDFPFPMTVTVVQLLSITLYSGPFFNFYSIHRYQDIPRSYYLKLIIPLALGKFLASVTSHISLWKVPVSYAHTIKATMPLFTVILTRLLFGERQPRLVYLSLIPIICGVCIATVTEISFDLLGLISALISTMGFSLQNIFSKKVLKDTGIHHLRLLHLLGKLALFMFLPIWLYVDSLNVLRHPTITSLDYRILALLFFDGVLNWLQNIIAFSVLSLVVPLTYAVASASKRIFVIAVSLILLGNPVTWLNCVGMTLAIIGVLCYNRAKQITRETTTLLPLAHRNPIKYMPLADSIPPPTNRRTFDNGAVLYNLQNRNQVPTNIYNNNNNNNNNNNTSVSNTMATTSPVYGNSVKMSAGGIPNTGATRLLFV